jgi:hypothetical protein
MVHLDHKKYRDMVARSKLWIRCWNASVERFGAPYQGTTTPVTSEKPTGLWWLTNEKDYCRLTVQKDGVYFKSRVPFFIAIMIQNHEHDDDEDLPWDPLWAYVLGEDSDERERRDDNTRRSGQYPREESRDGGEASTGILKTLWQRRKWGSLTAPSSTSNGESSGQLWQWELDTSPFVLLDNDSNNDKQKGSDKKTLHAKKSQDSSWMGTMWKDPSIEQNNPSSLRKSS